MASLSKNEKEILKKISESGLISKPELSRHMEKAGNKDAVSIVETITRKLMEQKFVSSISPVGSTCYIITQKGNQYMKELEA